MPECGEVGIGERGGDKRKGVDKPDEVGVCIACARGDIGGESVDMEREPACGGGAGLCGGEKYSDALSKVKGGGSESVEIVLRTGELEA